MNKGAVKKILINMLNETLLLISSMKRIIIKKKIIDTFNKVFLEVSIFKFDILSREGHHT